MLRARFQASMKRLPASVPSNCKARSSMSVANCTRGGGVGFHFAQQGALVDDLSARRVHHFAEGGDGGGERGNAGGGRAVSGGGGVADGGAGKSENGRGLVQKHLFQIGRAHG